MILLLFANSWYSGVILTGGIYYRGASNKILTALRGCLLDKRGLLIEVGVYQVIYDIAVNACGLTMYINIDLLTEFCRPIQAICCHSTSNPAETRRVQPVSFSLNCIETKQTSYSVNMSSGVINGNHEVKSIKTGVGFTWAYSHVPGFEYVPLLACSKTYYQFTSQVVHEGKFKMHFQ